MFKKNDLVEILPGFQDPGDNDFQWVVLEDEDGGRVEISPVDIPMNVRPRYIVLTNQIQHKGKTVRHEAVESEGLNGPGLAWGVTHNGAVVYEAMFREATAMRLAELCDVMPDQGWDEHSTVLAAEGYSLDDPAVVTRKVEVAGRR